MGLKYNLFIAEGDPDRLLTDMVKRGAVDETALMLEEQQFDKEQLDALVKLSKDQTTPRENKAKLFDEILNRKRRPELETYNKRQKEDFTEFSIWWMKAPFAPGWIVGGYTSYFFLRQTGGAISAGQLHEGLPIIYFVYYHHSSNEGIVIKSVKGGDVLGETLKPLEEETERFEVYIERIGKEHKIPVVELHNWIYSIHGAIPWTHEVTWKPKERQL